MRTLADITRDVMGRLTIREFAAASRIGVSTVGNLLHRRRVKDETIDKLVAYRPEMEGEIRAAVSRDLLHRPEDNTKAVRFPAAVRSTQQQPEPRERRMIPDDPLFEAIAGAWKDLDDRQRRDLAKRAVAALPSNKRRPAPPKVVG